eukprot:14197-Alexandrium_andersonii.AAC.1
MPEPPQGRWRWVAGGWQGEPRRVGAFEPREKRTTQSEVPGPTPPGLQVFRSVGQKKSSKYR